jgi:TRAP transporter 4TM/12TM fusion protein
MSLARSLGWPITIIALVMAVYHLFTSVVFFYSPLLHQNTHLAFALVLVFLLSMRNRPRFWPVMLLFILASLGVTGYVALFFDKLELRAGYPTVPDIYVSIMMIFLVLEAAREAYGYPIPLIATVLLGYLFLGHYLPPPLQHIRLDPYMLLSWLGTGFSGIFGTYAMDVSAKFLFMFILFGGVLRASGVIPLFLEIGKLAGRKMVSGAAQTAVISSGLVGTVSGSATANVGITGSFTIPLMKTVGHSPNEAGAIEATASSGGQIMPPIMGVGAFMLAAITGIPYWHVCIGSFIPAIFFYLSISVGIELRARKIGIVPSNEAINTKVILRKGLLFVVPIGIIFYLLAQGHSPMYVATCATVATVLTATLVGVITKERPSLRDWVHGFSQGAIEGAKLAVTCGPIGIIVAVMITTGLGMKLSSLIIHYSHGIVPLTLLLTMLISLLLGCGVPTMAAYVLVAITVCPALEKLGITMLGAHLFCYYFAVFSNVTPPIATASLPAAALSGGSYMKISVEACKLSLYAYIIPYVFVYNNSFLAKMPNPVLGLVCIAALGVSVFPMAAAMVGYLKTRLTMASRGLAAIAAVVLIACAANSFGYAYFLFPIGLTLFIFFIVYQSATRKKLQIVYDSEVDLATGVVGRNK